MLPMLQKTLGPQTSPGMTLYGIFEKFSFVEVPAKTNFHVFAPSMSLASPLKHAVVVMVERSGPYWLAESNELGIYASGLSEETALNAFDEDFIDAYEGLVNEPDGHLTPDAVLLKRRILGYVR